MRFFNTPASTFSHICMERDPVSVLSHFLLARVSLNARVPHFLNASYVPEYVLYYEQDVVCRMHQVAVLLADKMQDLVHGHGKLRYTTEAGSTAEDHW